MKWFKGCKCFEGRWIWTKCHLVLLSSKHPQRLCSRRHIWSLWPVFLSTPSWPPCWGGAGEHSWAPASPLWALIPYSCAPYSLIPSHLPPPSPSLCSFLLPAGTSRVLIHFSPVTHAEQGSRVPLDSPPIWWQAHIRSQTHNNRSLYASNYTPLRSKGERNNVSHSHMHTAVNVYRKSPLALAPEALLWDRGEGPRR